MGGVSAVTLDFPTGVAPQSSEQPAWKVPAVYNILLLSCWSLHPDLPSGTSRVKPEQALLWVAVENAMEGSLPLSQLGTEPRVFG